VLSLIPACLPGADNPADLSPHEVSHLKSLIIASVDGSITEFAVALPVNDNQQLLVGGALFIRAACVRLISTFN
jgi:hypothetical protein